MAIQKNFVVKNGIEVNDNLIFADKTSNKVGIGTTSTPEKLQVNGGIGATSLVLSGVGTIPTIYSNQGYIVTGVVTTLSGTTLNYNNGNIVSGVVTDISGSRINYSGIATVGSLSIGSTQVISSGGELQNIVSLDATTTATIESAIASGPNTFTNLIVTGISTLGVTGITTLNVTGIATFSNVDINGGDIEVSNVDTTNLYVSGISTLGTVLVSSGIITATSGIVTYYGDGTNLSLAGNPDLVSSSGIGIGTTGGLVGYGITFLDLKGAGVSTTFYNSSVGIATIFFEGGGGGGGGAIGIGSTFPGTPLSIALPPSNGDLFFHIDYGRTFIYYDETILGVGSSAFWIDSSPFNIGIITAIYGGVAFSDGTAGSPSWYFENDVTTGVFSPVNGELTFVSTGSSVLNINQSGVIVTGITSATSFVKSGGTSSQFLKADGSIDSNTYLTTETQTLNDVLGLGNTSSLGMSVGVVTCTDINSTSDVNLKENITTVNSALSIVNDLRGVKFEWKKDHKVSYGVIAQELEQVLPDLVTNTDPKTVNYNGLIGVLIQAVKELSAEVEDLKNKLS